MIRRERLKNRKKGRRQIAAALAAVMLVMPLSASAGFAQEQGAAPMDLSYGSVTVTIPEAEDFDRLRDLNTEGAVAVDLYKVASAKPLVVNEQAYDAYVFEWDVSGFAGCEALYSEIQKKAEEDESKITAAEINTFTQELAKAVLTDKTVTSATVTGRMDEKINVPANQTGLYLVLVHGTGVAMDAYTKEGEADTALTTVVQDTGSLYQFAPMMVSIPNRGLGEFSTDLIIDGDEEAIFGAAVGRTSNVDAPWINDLSIEAKVKVGSLYGSLQINKTLNSYGAMSGRIEPGTFVFRVTARETADEESATLYTNVASVTVSAAGATNSATLNQIPLGSFVTVEEIYAGPNYIRAPQQGPVEITPDNPDTETVEMASVTFTNTYDGTHWNGGGSVNNHFGTIETNGEWTWDNRREDEDGTSTKTKADNGGVEEYSIFTNDIPAE